MIQHSPAYPARLKRRWQDRSRWVMSYAFIIALLWIGPVIADMWLLSPDFIAAWQDFIAQAETSTDAGYRFLGFVFDVVLPVGLTAIIVFLGLFCAIAAGLAALACISGDSVLDFVEGGLHFIIGAVFLTALQIPFEVYHLLVILAVSFLLSCPRVWPVALTVTWRGRATGVLPLAPEVAKSRITPPDLAFDAAKQDGAAPLHFIDPIKELAVTTLDAHRVQVTETTLGGRKHRWEATYTFMPHPEGCLVTLDLTLHNTAPGCKFRLWNQNAAMKAVHALQAAYGTGAIQKQGSAEPSLS